MDRAQRLESPDADNVKKLNSKRETCRGRGALARAWRRRNLSGYILRIAAEVEILRERLVLGIGVGKGHAQCEGRGGVEAHAVKELARLNGACSVGEGDKGDRLLAGLKARALVAGESAEATRVRAVLSHASAAYRLCTSRSRTSGGKPETKRVRIWLALNSYTSEDGQAREVARTASLPALPEALRERVGEAGCELCGVVVGVGKRTEMASTHSSRSSSVAATRK